MNSEASTFLNNPKDNVNREVVHKSHQTYARVYDNISEVIGNTPLVRLNHIPQSYGLKCEIFAKCEFLNPGGSVKDRIAQRMIEDSEKLGFIRPGATLVEATSGNTGIGLAMVAAVKGYKMIAAMPEKISHEKENIMKGLGAKIIRTPNEVNSASPESHISMAIKTRDSIPGAVILDQYNNSSNPVAHYDHTGQEIVDQCQGKLDFFFAGIGTGGTMTGCAAKIKEKIPSCKCIGIDPQLSILAEGTVIGDAENPSLLPEFVHVEGIGYDFIPNACVRSSIDAWVKTRDEESFEMARRIIREEGLLVGGSSGAVLAAVIKYAQKYELNENHRVVVLFADSVRNYINKFLSDDWMIDRGFLSNELYLDKESKLYGKTPKDLNLQPLKCFDKDLTVGAAFDQFEKGVEVIPILEAKKVRGVLYPNKFMGCVMTKKLEDSNIIERIIDKDFVVVKMDTDLSIVQKFLDRYQVVLVQEKKDNETDPIIYEVNTKHLLKYYV